MSLRKAINDDIASVCITAVLMAIMLVVGI
jgi:hypothetical protein